MFAESLLNILPKSLINMLLKPLSRILIQLLVKPLDTSLVSIFIKLVRSILGKPLKMKTLVTFPVNIIAKSPLKM